MYLKGWPQEQGWYEASLPLKERKRRGHFSTPPRLVEQILDACGYTPDKDITQIRVLDPACGSGNFLAGAARRLVISGTRVGLSQCELATLVQRNLWGFDPDPISCFLAEMQLRTVEAQCIASNISTSLHIHQADGLALPWETYERVDLFVANPPYLAAKNSDLSGYRSTHQRGQADSYLLFLNLALQIVRPRGWIGLVLPDPVLARANATRERFSLLENFTIHHLWHLSGVFTAQVGAVVIIAQKTPLQSTHQISWVRDKWEQITVGAQCIAPKFSPKFAPKKELDDEMGAMHCAPTIPQSLFLRQPRGEFRYLLNDHQGSAIERLRSSLDQPPSLSRRLAPLGEFLSISRGEELGRDSPHLVAVGQPQPSTGMARAGAAEAAVTRAGTARAAMTEAAMTRAAMTRAGMARATARVAPTIHGAVSPSDSPGRDSHIDSRTWYPVLRGGVDIRPYGTPGAHWEIARTSIAKPLERYLAPKLVVVKSTPRLQAVLDTKGHVALQTLYLLHSRTKDVDEDELYFFLALLNSRLLEKYVYMLHTAYKWVQPQIEQHVLARLPIPLSTPDEKREIIARSRLLVHACSESCPVVEWEAHIQSMYEAQERAICALYDAALPGLFC